MRNRAKCKLCQEVIESFHRYDFVACKCGEISVDGGLDQLRCAAKDWKNFLRVDDADKEIEVTAVDEAQVEDAKEVSPLNRREMIDMLEAMIKNIENLPKHAMDLPINHYDFYSYMMLVVAVLKEGK